MAQVRRGKVQFTEFHKRSHIKTVLTNIAPGFERIETVTVVDILRRAGARVTLANTFAGIMKRPKA